MLKDDHKRLGAASGRRSRDQSVEKVIRLGISLIVADKLLATRFYVDQYYHTAFCIVHSPPN